MHANTYVIITTNYKGIMVCVRDLGVIDIFFLFVARLALRKMCDLASQDCVEETDSHGLICLAAHMAFEVTI